jgi:hypothetical protein
MQGLPNHPIGKFDDMIVVLFIVTPVTWEKSANYFPRMGGRSAVAYQGKTRLQQENLGAETRGQLQARKRRIFKS